MSTKTAPTLSTLSVAALGGLCGAMLTIRVVLVPFWREADTASFRTWFAQRSPRIATVMIGLGSVSVATTSAAAAVRRGRPGGPSSVACAALTLCLAGVTFTVNEPMNKRFASSDAIPPAQTRQMLDRWARWHDVRLVLGAAALSVAARSPAVERRLAHVR